MIAPAARTSQTGRAVEPGEARSNASSVIRANGTSSLTRAAADTERWRVAISALIDRNGLPLQHDVPRSPSRKSSRLVRLQVCRPVIEAAGALVAPEGESAQIDASVIDS